MPTKLFRPVGIQELALLWDSGMKEFPPRLVQQPIFYPVVNLEYARQIARDWNTPDKNSGFAGFVTQFEVSSTSPGTNSTRRARRRTGNTGFRRGK
jgi:hypothetical protein